MKSRKQKPAKAEHTKRKVQSDVVPSTSLPPLVEGQLRCFLRVTVSRVQWMVHKPPSVTFVRLRWWGESSNGTHFCPKDGSQQSQNTIKTTACFPIRCGPKQFTSYLTDMGSLVLEVLTKPDHLPIARAQVAGISQLSLTQPISGFYSLISPTSEKLGELQVSLSLEALTEAYDFRSSVPNTDMNTKSLPVSTVSPPLPTRSHFAGRGKDLAGSSGGNTPRGKDHLYFQDAQKHIEESLENEMASTNRSHNGQLNPSSQEPCGQTNNDILSVILDRGNKLRDAMVASALKGDMDSSPALKDAPLPLPKDNILPPSRPISSSSGMFLQNILNDDLPLKHADDVAAISEYGLHSPSDLDNRAVDLFLSSLNSSLPLFDGEKFLHQSLSGHSSVCGDSDLNDLQYDQSLLENLFYKTHMSEMGPSDTEGKSQETVSPRKKQTKPKKRGGLNSEPKRCTEVDVIAPALSAEQMSLLSAIRLARVTIDSLTVPADSSATRLQKNSSKGKPPPSTSNKKCTYFIEYVFPVNATSNRRDLSKDGNDNVTRVVSRKVTGGLVKFHHRSMFPVDLSAATIKKWSGNDLIFKIYSRNSYQKKPVPIGKAVHPLHSLLQSKQLSQSVVLPVQSIEGNTDVLDVGPLKVSLELVTANKDLSSERNKSKLVHKDISPSQAALSPQHKTSSRTQHVHSGSEEELPADSFEDSRLHVWTPQKPTEEPLSHPDHQTSHKIWQQQQQEEQDSEILLHTLLMVPDGKNFSCGPMKAPNVYLNCKLFWCDEMARSIISWGQANPTFSFVQVTPVALTTKLLERMKNNVMVVEVWQKTGSSMQDQLLGLVKLPLHQFYMSFRDPKIAHLLLQAQYPVLGVDSYMPVIDVFSGRCKGNLRVVLAMGRWEQIISLKRTRDEECDSAPHLTRPVHLLDHLPHAETKAITGHKKRMREHLFVVRVEKVNGLTPLQSTVWGEADCYVQYSFPNQEGELSAPEDQNLIETGVNLKMFRTTTTLCVPDPVFGHTETHVLVAPEEVPVQKLLLSSLLSQGLSNGGGVQFEVWCRYYYPNVRDQLVAKGMLPLSKLCAMVTVQGQHPDEPRIFSLPLIPRTETPPEHQPRPSGLLDVCVRYKHRPVRSEGQMGQGAASRLVTLIVQVHRASGLQAAARFISEQDERFGHLASTALNIYITVQLSFLPERERRCTRVAAKTFCPEFDHHMEVPCDLLLQSSSGETRSLAEQLEEASALFTVWNRDSRKATFSNKPKDVMLGTVKIPLADLIHKRTGISGWFGVSPPPETSFSPQQHILVGGLNVSIRFAHHSDRERVIKDAQVRGWEMAQNEVQEDEDAWTESRIKLSLTISTPRLWLPLHCLLLPGHSELQRSTYCYFRYKFYHQESFCSQMKHPSVKESGQEGQATVTFQGSSTVELRSSQPLLWYLHEEKLEIQVWVAFTKDKTQRPRDTDRLVGSAFVDLSSVAKTTKQQITVSGVYPLFRRSASDLQGAALRVHITGIATEEDSDVAASQMNPDNEGEPFSEEVDIFPEDMKLMSDDVEEDHTPLTITPKKTGRMHNHKSSRATPDITAVPRTAVNEDESFPVTIAVDQAMHLNLSGCPLADRSEESPCCCVSYVTADSPEPVSTAVIARTDCPVWNHQHECRLSKQLLVDPQEYLVFKVWHKGELERVVGFASVDLSPLLSGFHSVCGWYNITDLSGQCHGQLKVSVTPLRTVQDLRGQRKSVIEETAKNPAALFQAFPVSYQTSATYSSFPSHISRYPEQKISSPDRAGRLFSEGSGDSDRHTEHMDKVRLFHQSLQEQTASHSVCSASAGDINPSSSILFAALRKKLSELDNIQRYFDRKLSVTTFPSTSDQDCSTGHDQQGGQGTCQLPLQSRQLVGEVNNIHSGLLVHLLERISSNSQSSSTSSSVVVNSLQTVTEITSPLRGSNSPVDKVTSLPSLRSEVCEDHSDVEPEEEKDRKHPRGSDSENTHGTDKDEAKAEDLTAYRQDMEVDDDDEEDYDEVVVNQRPLNEATSLTDKTSPWTSILSDPDLASLESVEQPEDLSPRQEEDERLMILNLETSDCSSKRECVREEESNSLIGSAGGASDTDSDNEITLHGLAERQERGTKSSEEGSEEEDHRSPTTLDTTDSHDPSCSPVNQDSPQQAGVAVEVPNFFLPSHQLEASMKAIRLAASFSQTTTDKERPLPAHHRGPRQLRDMSPSSRKKETERIARIFSAHFNDDK